MLDLLGHVGVDHSCNLGSKHPGGDPKIAACMSRIYVTDQIWVHHIVGMVMIYHDHVESVDLGLFHCRNVFLGRAVVHQDNEWHLLVVPSLVLKGISQILGHVF